MKNSRGIKRRVTYKHGHTAGLPPGTAVFIGEQKQDFICIDIIRYSPEEFEEIGNASLDDCLRMRKLNGVTWINVTGIHDLPSLKALATQFGLHPLTTEDIANTGQRPKAEEFPDYLFFALKVLQFDNEEKRIVHENAAVVLGDRFVLSFQEKKEVVLDPLRERIRNNKGRLRSEGADYLAYAILDNVVDEYFVALENLGDHIEDIDDEILEAPDSTHMKEIHHLKREIVFLRKAVWPLREEIASIEKSGSPLIGSSCKHFFRDLYEHSIQIIDLVETYRDIISGMQDTFLSSISNRMNEVMKVLTIIGTIFIPLTFIAGVYGMNFEYMPELKWHWGYFGVLGLMALISLVMLYFFRRRHWL